MNNRIFDQAVLCGHTGSQNRGCEAIVRSTSKLLKEMGLDVITYSFDINGDCLNHLQETVHIKAYPQKTFVMKVLSFAVRKILKNYVWGNQFYNKHIFKECNTQTVIFNIGGDTYCYTKPWISIALNKTAQKKKVPTVFWGCSVEKSIERDDDLREDINRYSFIVARESLSYEILKRIYNKEEKLYLACDPAFHLDIKETKLPENFLDKNTIGINLSPLVFENYKNNRDMMWLNIQYLFEYILNNTDINICLIPHVYNVEGETQDLDVLNKLYKQYQKSDRISIIKKELSCTELKYIISRCRFFIGARTHATIAAYSTEVPAIALSYSIKSRGIAKDLFGTETGFAMPWKNVTKPEQLCANFIETLLKKENLILKRYKEVLPEYKKSIVRVTSEILLSKDKGEL